MLSFFQSLLFYPWLPLLYILIPYLSVAMTTLAFLLRTGILEPDERKGREERLSHLSWYWVARLEIWRHCSSTSSGCKESSLS